MEFDTLRQIRGRRGASGCGGWKRLSRRGDRKYLLFPKATDGVTGNVDFVLFDEVDSEDGCEAALCDVKRVSLLLVIISKGNKELAGKCKR